MNHLLLSKLNRDKIKISSRSPIRMDLFLSFLTVETTPNKNCLGSDNGWTEHLGANDLVIRGGIVGGVEYLDSIQYKRKLSDPYSNYVNPFFIKEILNHEGIYFFLDFYQEDLNKLRKEAQDNVAAAEKHLSDVLSLLADIAPSEIS